MSQERYNGNEKDHSQELKDFGREELDKLLNEKARDAKHEHAEQIDDIRSETKAESLPSDQILEQHRRAEEQPNDMPQLVNRDLKKTKYNRTLRSVQKDLSAPEKVLSKVMHNPVIDALSEGAEKTVARPSGVLAGSICAFIGSCAFLYISKHYGYEYNFLLFVLLFIGGFFLGLLIELALRTAKKSPRN